jgi:hypothetical protein
MHDTRLLNWFSLENNMYRDFGPGLTVDELIDMPAFHIDKIKLPPEVIFQKIKMAARKMITANLESFVLAEIWEDGHTAWRSLKDESPALITPGGHLIRTKNKRSSD